MVIFPVMTEILSIPVKYAIAPEKPQMPSYDLIYNAFFHLIYITLIIKILQVTVADYTSDG